LKDLKNYPNFLMHSNAKVLPYYFWGHESFHRFPYRLMKETWSEELTMLYNAGYFRDIGNGSYIWVHQLLPFH
jgi:hypothetical protein